MTLSKRIMPTLLFALCLHDFQNENIFSNGARQNEGGKPESDFRMPEAGLMWLESRISPLRI